MLTNLSGGFVARRHQNRQDTKRLDLDDRALADIGVSRGRSCTPYERAPAEEREPSHAPLRSANSTCSFSPDAAVIKGDVQRMLWSARASYETIRCCAAAIKSAVRRHASRPTGRRCYSDRYGISDGLEASMVKCFVAIEAAWRIRSFCRLGPTTRVSIPMFVRPWLS